MSTPISGNPTTMLGAATSTSAQSTAPAPPSNQLGQDAFLQLLTTELENQDPTKPMDDTQFISQLATFSSLQTLNHIDGTMNSVASSLQTLNQLIAGKLASSVPAGGPQ